MTAILLVLSMIAQVLQHVFRKEYDKRDINLPWCFSLFGVLTTLLYFVFTGGGKFEFTKDMLLYAIPFSICYTIAYICTIFAIRSGPLSLTSLIISCSVSMPVLYGVLALGEPVTLPLCLGLVMLVLSIAFVSEPWKKEDAPISLKWAIYAGITFLANGICVTVQKLYQITDKGVHSSEFMISSLSITLATILIFVLLYEIKGILPFMKKGLLWPFLCGASNGVANHLTMILAVVLPA